MALNYPTEYPEDGMVHEYDLYKDTLVPVKADDVFQSPAYFKDDKAYYYKWNEGFFVKDFNSGIEKKIAEPVAKDSSGKITKDYLIQGSGYTYDKEGNGWITIYNLEGEVLEKIELKTDEDSFYMGFLNFETSDRLFFAVVKLDGTEDVYYILKKDIGSGKTNCIFSYTNGSSRVYVDPEKQ
ncbi:hypothetical protein ACPWSR_07560 [Alloiococcus sp. CFN-8]|uniref:hypothetical protein n=1 Tax=Alloiococcus sp. CFN-8 TaxID=3416081 RepID=UPI003CF0B629